MSSSPHRELGRPLSFHTSQFEPASRIDAPQQSSSGYDAPASSSGRLPATARTPGPGLGGNAEQPVASSSRSGAMAVPAYGPESLDQLPSSAHDGITAIPFPASDQAARTPDSPDSHHDVPSQSQPLPPATSTPPSDSGTSSTVRNQSEEEATRERRSDEVGDPSQKHFKKAALVAGATAGAGSAGGRFLAKGGDRQPRGFEDVEVENKWHFFHPQIRDERREAVKVSWTDRAPIDEKILIGPPGGSERSAPVRLHHYLAMGLPLDLLGIDIQARDLFLPPDRALRLVRHRPRLVPHARLDPTGRIRRRTTQLHPSSRVGGPPGELLSERIGGCGAGCAQSGLLGGGGDQCERDECLARGAGEWG